MTTTEYLTILGAISQYLVPWDDYNQIFDNIRQKSGAIRQYLVPWDDHNQIFDNIWCYWIIFTVLGRL